MDDSNRSDQVQQQRTLCLGVKENALDPNNDFVLTLHECFDCSILSCDEFDPTAFEKEYRVRYDDSDFSDDESFDTSYLRRHDTQNEPRVESEFIYSYNELQSRYAYGVEVSATIRKKKTPQKK